MDLLLLPGSSPQNKEWIEAVRDTAKDKFDKTAIQYYDHWKSGIMGDMDLDREIEKLPETTNDLGDYAVFAKSAGVLLALKAVAKGIISPKKCLFVGTAVHMGQQVGMDFKKIFGALDVPILFVQKEQDSAGSFEELQKLVEDSGLSDYEMVKIGGQDHYYGDIKGLVNMLH